jgi:cation diffusion facilitator CzcD-associated flavoprotein CzcO
MRRSAGARDADPLSGVYHCDGRPVLREDLAAHKRSDHVRERTETSDRTEHTGRRGKSKGSLADLHVTGDQAVSLDQLAGEVDEPPWEHARPKDTGRAGA